MELAYKVKPKSDYYQYVINTLNFAKEEYMFIKDFFGSHQGLVCDYYVVRVMGTTNTLITKENVKDLEFGIEVDEDKLGDDVLIQFKKPNKNNVRYLKKNSKLMKEFRNLALEQELVTNTYILTPIEFYDLYYVGRYSWHRFMTLDGELYIKLNIDNEQFNFSHDDFESIKLSEYYQKLEQYKEERSC